MINESSVMMVDKETQFHRTFHAQTQSLRPESSGQPF
jgi:hypothetical protein